MFITKTSYRLILWRRCILQFSIGKNDQKEIEFDFLLTSQYCCFSILLATATIKNPYLDVNQKIQGFLLQQLSTIELYSITYWACMICRSVEQSDPLCNKCQMALVYVDSNEQNKSDLVKDIMCYFFGFLKSNVFNYQRWILFVFKHFQIIWQC